MTIVAQILNFLILVLILKFVAYKPVMKMLKEREEKIARSIDAAEADEQKAKELLAEYNKQLADARIKAQEIVDKAMKRAQEERDASVAETRREIEQMRKAAKEDIARERERAAMQLRGEMVALSMQAAGKLSLLIWIIKQMKNWLVISLTSWIKIKWVDCHAEFTVSKKIRCGNV